MKVRSPISRKQSQDPKEKWLRSLVSGATGKYRNISLYSFSDISKSLKKCFATGMPRFLKKISVIKLATSPLYYLPHVILKDED